MGTNTLRLSERELAARIRTIMDAIRSPEHADDIIELRRVLRKHVPFFFRSYFAAYLLRDLVESGRPGPRKAEEGSRRRDEPGRDKGARDGGKQRTRDAEGGARQPRKDSRPRQESQPRQPSQSLGQQQEKRQERRPPLPESVPAATLFVSAGRKRHFYPRHMLELFEQNGIALERVGEIRLFDNYMFVQVAAEAADEAIARMDGTSFKGRRLAVNYARKKEDQEDRSGSAESVAPPEPASDIAPEAPPAGSTIFNEEYEPDRIPDEEDEDDGFDGVSDEDGEATLFDDGEGRTGGEGDPDEESDPEA